LDTVDCRGSIATIAAQKHIVDKQADYVMALKANQGTLYQQVKDFMGKQDTHCEVKTSAFIS